MTGPTVPVDVRVVLRPYDDLDGGRKVREVISAVVLDLARQLDLPVGPVGVTVESGPRPTISINGSERMVLADRYLLRHTASMIDRVAQTIHSAVELVLPDEGVATVWARSAGSALPHPAWFPGLVRDLLRCRVRLGRLGPLLADGAPPDAAALFEAALSAAGRPIGILLNERSAQSWAADRRRRRDLLVYLATGLYEELALPVAVPRLEVDATVPDGYFAVAVNDLRTLPLPEIGADQIVVNDTAERLKLMSVVAEPIINPATGLPAALTSSVHADLLDAAGETHWDSSGYIVLTVAEMIRRHAHALLRHELLEYQLDRLAPDLPVLRPMIGAIGGTGVLVRVLRRLLREEVPIGNLYGVVSTLYGATRPRSSAEGFVMIPTRRNLAHVVEAPEIGDVAEAVLAETARAALTRSITSRYTRGTATLVAYLIDVTVENRLRNPEKLTADERRAMLDMIESEMAHLPPTAQRPIILTRAPVRARLRAVIEDEQPRLVVAAYEELPGDLNVQPVARLSLAT